MWVMTSWGVLMPGLRPKEHVPAGDNREIQIRARRRIELERVCAFYPELELRKEDIVHFSFTDYEYRLYCTKAQLGTLLALIAMDVNYVKFKSSTEKFNEQKLHLFYNRVWGIYYDMFSTNRYLEKLVKKVKKNKHHQGQPLPAKPGRKLHWWEDTDRIERTETF